jgi:diguanylate cyclase (GGDEF)-like protein/PAS domain S-box-containing protein
VPQERRLRPSREDRRLARLRAANLALRELALLDELTGLANRRAFLARLDEEFARAREQGASFSLLLLDLDGLKDINDTFSHQTGDAALRHFARRLADGVRWGDLVARIGGDEFAVIAVHRDPSESAGFAARLAGLAAPAEFCDPFTGRAIALSATTGIATYDPSCPSARTLFAQADIRLGAAKQSGHGGPASPSPGAYVPRGRRTVAAELRALLAMAREVVAAADPREMLDRAAVGAARLMEAGFAAAGLVVGDGRVAYDGYVWDGARHPWQAVCGPEDGITGRVLRTHRAVVVNAGDPDAPVPEHPALRTALAVPVRDSALIGVLLLAERQGDRPFSADDADTAQAFADLAALAVERARAHAESETTRAYLHSLMEQASDAILVVDPRTHRVIDANRAAERLTGYDRAELQRMTSADLRAPRSRGGPSLGELAMARGESVKAVRWYQHKDGAVIPVEGSAAPVNTPLGPAVIVILRPLSDAPAHGDKAD